MVKIQNSKKAFIVFSAVLTLIGLLLAASIIKTAIYNNKKHSVLFSGPALFSADGAPDGQKVYVKASARTSTWTKLFDFHDEGLTENNYQAFTYDFTVFNDTRDQIGSFSFTLRFDRDVYLFSAWNGALEIHQIRPDGELVETVPDLREFDPSGYSLEIYTADGDCVIAMRPGDYLNYIPSESIKAKEMPIEAGESTTPGIILYTAIGESIEGASLELRYSFHRVVQNEPLFWITCITMLIWVIALIIYLLTSLQIKKYQARHDRDNEIISESIETFTAFIDAKDPYTNGHSSRVADYTMLLAKEMGYSGEELDHIYYVALLHDCGKIGVPDTILRKPGRLTDEEFEIIKSHTVRGGEILKHFKSLEDVDEGARYHHERYDGKGYPEGKAGEDIPLIARMICVADSFDAMNSDRVYRKRLSREIIMQELETNKGRQFDPAIAELMLRLIREKKIPVSQ